MLFNSYYNTNPLILHKPGGNDVDIWNRIVSLFFKIKISATLPDDLTIVTWNNKESSLLEDCFSKLNLNYTILGKGIENWKNPMKIQLLNEEFKNIKTKWILGLDSHDVIMIGDPAIVLKRFQEKKCKLLYNSGPINYPPILEDIKQFELSINDLKHRFPHLNAGAFIGETEFCKKFYKEAYENGKKELAKLNSLDDEYTWMQDSEQIYIKKIFPKFYPSVQLDYNCSIFQIFHPMSHQTWVRGAIKFL